MKQIKSLRNSLAVAALALTLGGASVMADGHIGSITIQGTVDAVNEITVTPQAGYNTLDLVAGVTDAVVAVVNEKNNNTDGYTVTLESANAAVDGDSVARLKGADDAANTIVYTIKYNGSAVELNVGGTSVVTSDGTNTGTDGVDKDLQVTTTAGWHHADTYSDTLTLTIASK